MTQKCTVEVIFSGVSTHFRNGIVAGIPHRVVLPDASHFFTDYISIGDGDPLLYYLNPHFARLSAEGMDFTIPGLITNGYIHSGVRLQVGNGIPTHDLRANDSSTNGLGFDPKLRSYDPNCEYSADVVTGGRAACYFDFDYGWTEWLLPNDDLSLPAWRFSITVETEGYPWLLVTPLNPTAATPPTFTKLALGDSPHVTLQVNNLETHREEAGDQRSGQFDFLFNFLTSRGGIPQHIVKATPGLENPVSATAAQIATALQDLANLLRPLADGPAAFYGQLAVGLMGQTPACSPAQFG
jgi:hypothetical protein